MAAMVVLKGPNGERRIPMGTPYKLLPGEVRVNKPQWNQQTKGELENLAEGNKIGVGDLVNAMTSSTGFKEWWDEKHGGQCIPCVQRQATYNYLQFKGPKWLSDWVGKHKESK